MTANVQSMMYVGKRPWHGLGKELADPATALEAINAAGLDWRVSLRTLWAETADGKRIVKDQYATVREDNSEVLGVVGDKYRPIQNAEAFNFFDAVVGSGDAKYHTAGALGLGERVWILAQLPGTVQVDGTDDHIEKFLLLSNSHDGSSCLRMLFTPVRVVCQNTLNIALGGGVGQGIAIRHTENAKGKVEEARRALGLAMSYYDGLGGLCTRLAAVPAAKADLNRYFLELVPDNSAAKVKTRTENIRGQLVDLFHNGKGNRLEGVRGSWWAAFNAVTEWTDHERSTRGEDSGDKAESRLASNWFGSGAQIKGRAWTLALEAANVKA